MTLEENGEWWHSACASRHGDKLAISLLVPEQSKNAVVMLPGFTSRRLNATNKTLAKHLASVGVACVAVDPSGHGDSSGRIEEQTILKAADEISDVIGCVLGMGIVKREAGVAVLGNSFSGTAAVIAASRDPRVSCLALKSPVVDYTAMRESQLGAEAMKRWREEGMIDLPDGVSSSYAFIEAASSVDICSLVREIRCPILAVHGDDDEQIPRMQRDALRDAMISGGKEYVSLMGGDHVLSDPSFVVAIDLLLGFFVRHLLSGFGI